ncbi:MAG: type II secretion system protein [Planctomycetota bacterium]
MSARGAAQRGGANRRGHTLIELVVVISILAMLAGAVSLPIVEATRGNQARSARLRLLDEIRPALIRILEDTRSATRMGGLGVDLTVAETEQLGFGEVRYRLNGSTLERSEDAGSHWKPMAKGLSSLTFGYVNSTGTAIVANTLSETERRSVRRVVIEAELTDGEELVTVRTSAYFHNLAFTDD